MRSHRILFVDDDALVRCTLKRSLRRAGYTVDTADGAAAAVASAGRERYALIATDMNMPGKSGLELVHVLRPMQPQAVFVLVSGGDCDGLSSHAVDHVLQKPWESRELRRIVDAAVEQGAEPSEDAGCRFSG